MSIKSIGDDESEDGKKENNLDIAKSEESKKDESGEEKEEEKDGDITLGTFGFPDVVVEPTAFRGENTDSNETEKKEGDENEGNSVEKKEQKIENISDKGPEKSVDKSTTSSTGATSLDESAVSLYVHGCEHCTLNGHSRTLICRKSRMQISKQFHR